MPKHYVIATTGFKDFTYSIINQQLMIKPNEVNVLATGIVAREVEKVEKGGH